MAITDVNVKGIRHRGLYEGREQSVTGRFRLKAGDALATTDVINAIPLGENVQPSRFELTMTKLNGTPVLTNGEFNVGVAPMMTEAAERADGRVYPALSADDDLFGALDLDGVSKDALNVTVDPSSATKWGPFYVTLTPTEAISVAGGDVDIQLTVYFLGEKEEADPVYTEWQVNGGKYKNA